jgi:prefoldin alpha subunit
MSNKQEIQKQLQAISRNLQQYEEYSKELQKQLDTLNSYLADLNQSKKTMKNMDDEDSIKESIFHLGSGIMIKAKPLMQNEVLYNVGAGVIVNKSIKDALEKLDERIEEVEQQSSSLGQQLQQISNQMSGMERQAQQLIQQMQGPEKAQYDPNLLNS